MAHELVPKLSLGNFKDELNTGICVEPQKSSRVDFKSLDMRGSLKSSLQCTL